MTLIRPPRVKKTDFTLGLEKHFVSIGEDEARGHLLRKTEVVYPQLAEQARITGWSE
jgi:hypothetical protein